MSMAKMDGSSISKEKDKVVIDANSNPQISVDTKQFLVFVQGSRFRSGGSSRGSLKISVSHALGVVVISHACSLFCDPALIMMIVMNVPDIAGLPADAFRGE